MLYKLDNKQGCWFLPHGNKGTHKLHMITQQVKSNVQSLIDLLTNIMPHKMKWIKNGRQYMWHLLPETWKNMQEHNDQVNCMEWVACFLSIWQQTPTSRYMFFMKNYFSKSWTMMHPQLFWWIQLWVQRVKIVEGQGVGARSLAHNILGVEKRDGVLRWGQERMTSKSIIHTDLHKPNNKLVCS
jgi:hypothetical protein